MNLPVLARRAALAIGVLTALTGAIQMVAPAWILGFLQAEASTASSHFFSIVGMFMLLFGSLAVQALRTGEALPLLWCALQKFGASVFVALGVNNHVFASLALLVAAFDFLSGFLFLYCRRGLP